MPVACCCIEILARYKFCIELIITTTKQGGIIMKSALMSLVLMFTVSAFAEIKNGTYQCTNELEVGDEHSVVFVFDLTDEHIAIHGDDYKTIESVLIINKDETLWTTDSEGNKYKVERSLEALKTQYFVKDIEETTNKILFSGLTTLDLSKISDERFLLKTTEIEFNVVDGRVLSSIQDSLICTKN